MIMNNINKSIHWAKDKQSNAMNAKREAHLPLRGDGKSQKFS